MRELVHIDLDLRYGLGILSTARLVTIRFGLEDEMTKFGCMNMECTTVSSYK